MSRRDLERLHLLATMEAFGELRAKRLAEIANSECVHDALDEVPEISPRGITAKLNAMSREGLVEASPDEPPFWTLTRKGRGKATIGLAGLGPDGRRPL